MATYQLAQLNIARLAAPLESPQLADFVAALDRINALAEASAGFVWRLKTDEGNATALRPFGDDYIVNLSVWENLEALRDYVYNSDHRDVLRRRREWFLPMRDAHAVMWWVPRGHQPDEAEAQDRLMCLRRDGPTPAAFTFARAWPMPDEVPV